MLITPHITMWYRAAQEPSSSPQAMIFIHRHFCPPSAEGGHTETTLSTVQRLSNVPIAMHAHNISHSSRDESSHGMNPPP